MGKSGCRSSTTHLPLTSTRPPSSLTQSSMVGNIAAFALGSIWGYTKAHSTSNRSVDIKEPTISCDSLYQELVSCLKGAESKDICDKAYQNYYQCKNRNISNS